MFDGKLLKISGMVTLFLFIFFVLSTNIAMAQQEEDILVKARKLYQEGDYEGSIHLLDKFVTKLKEMVEQKKNVAEACYLLAKIYFEVGDDVKAEENLVKVYHACPAFEKEETNVGFKKKVEAIKQKVAMEKAEKEKNEPEALPKEAKKEEIKAESEQFESTDKVIEQKQTKPKNKKKKKFPVLLVVGGVVVVAAVILLLGKKSDNNDNPDTYDIRGRWTVNLEVIGESATFFITFSGSQTSGTFVDHDGDTGIYTVNNRTVHFEYDDYVISFDGSFSNNDTMSGSVNVSGYTGTWNGTRGYSTARVRSLNALKAKSAK